MRPKQDNWDIVLWISWLIWMAEGITYRDRFGFAIAAVVSLYGTGTYLVWPLLVRWAYRRRARRRQL